MEEPLIVTEKRHHLHIGLELTAAVVKFILTLTDIAKKLLTPRSVIAFILYGTFAYLAIKDKIQSEAITAVISVMMTFYYTDKLKNKEVKNDKTDIETTS